MSSMVLSHHCTLLSPHQYMQSNWPHRREPRRNCWFVQLKSKKGSPKMGKPVLRSQRLGDHVSRFVAGYWQNEESLRFSKVLKPKQCSGRESLYEPDMCLLELCSRTQRIPPPFFFCTHSIWKFQSQGSNLSLSCGPTGITEGTPRPAFKLSWGPESFLGLHHSQFSYLINLSLAGFHCQGGLSRYSVEGASLWSDTWDGPQLIVN